MDLNDVGVSSSVGDYDKRGMIRSKLWIKSLYLIPYIYYHKVYNKINSIQTSYIHLHYIQQIWESAKNNK